MESKAPYVIYLLNILKREDKVKSPAIKTQLNAFRLVLLEKGGTVRFKALSLLPKRS